MLTKFRQSVGFSTDFDRVAVWVDWATPQMLYTEPLQDLSRLQGVPPSTNTGTARKESDIIFIHNTVQMSNERFALPQEIQLGSQNEQAQ